MTSSEHWILRRSLASDAEAIFAIRSHPVTRRFQPIIPGSLEGLEQKLAMRGSLPLTPELSGTVQWTIVVASEPAGWVSIDVTERNHHVANLGYAVHPRHHGRGIASAAVQRVIAVAFDPHQIALERLEAVAAVDNHASRRVLEKCGFRCEGIARGLLIISGERVDHARYGLLGEDTDGIDKTVPTAEDDLDEHAEGWR